MHILLLNLRRRRRWWCGTSPTNIKVPSRHVKLDKVRLNLPAIRPIVGIASLGCVRNINALDLVLAAPGICEPAEGNVRAGHGVDRQDLERDRGLARLAGLEGGERGEGCGAEGEAGEEVDAVGVVGKGGCEDGGSTVGVEGGVDEESEAVDDVRGVGLAEAFARSPRYLSTGPGA